LWQLLVYPPIIPPDIISGAFAGIAKTIILVDIFYLFTELTPFQAHIFRFFFDLDLACGHFILLPNLPLYTYSITIKQ
jgi:hypothetical protein